MNHNAAPDSALQQLRMVLVETSHPGNIGSAARAMKVMGLRQLALVQPRHFPHAEATALASGAHDVLAAAQVCDDLDQALADSRLVLGTSARLRSLAWPQLDVREAAALALREAAQGPVHVLFGREKSGLSNEELQRCHYLVHIPTADDYSSLNLSQAVQVFSYELRMAALLNHQPVVAPADYQPVSAARMESLFTHLEQALLALRFLDPTHPKRLMMRLRRLLLRARPDDNEYNILRGILSAIEKNNPTVGGD
ncbi:MAG: tRNA (cytosine(32)/uridine(32)-2'-O)-methyltransferase TrmJ [Wenzhouxiangellaceae bacterium]